MPADPPPLIACPACVRDSNGLPFHKAGDKYVVAISRGAGAIPVVIPALGTAPPNGIPIDALLDRVDGLLMTGSPSNVHPERYGGTPSTEDTLHDPVRDDTTLPLIRAAVERGMPLLALCRGHQELNVALGGTLHQRLQELPGRLDHRSRKGDPIEMRYGPAHEVALAPGGLVARIANAETISVNSLHAQGIDRLAPGLVVEATAPDGTIEAVRVDRAGTFMLGIQWHPEWRFWENRFGIALFKAFGEAVRAYCNGARDRAAAE